jgi:hypothetical protein
MILIYSHKNTPRLSYVVKQLFTEMLQVPATVTTSWEEFEVFSGPKLEYTHKKNGEGIFLQSTAFLFETGIHEPELRLEFLEGLPLFFQVGKGSALPFDFFAFAFYFLSRYEEYLPHIKDEHERFEAHSSLAHQHDFLQKPVVDHWLMKLKALIQSRYPKFSFPEQQYRFLNTIDVDNAYAYRGKGLVRNLGGGIRQISELKFSDFGNRLLVVLGLKTDPFDAFVYLRELQERKGFESIYFFLLADYGHNDKNIPVFYKPFQSLIKGIADYAAVGIHPGYNTAGKPERLKKEVKRLLEITHREVVRSRQHFLRLSLPETYRRLIDLGIQEDYTMGYAREAGFRAGTSFPFHFYDLDMEQSTHLKLFPFAVMEGTLKGYKNIPTSEAMNHIRPLVDEVKAVNGLFISLWHNESVAETREWTGWRAVYEEMIDYAQ